VERCGRTAGPPEPAARYSRTIRNLTLRISSTIPQQNLTHL